MWHATVGGQESKSRSHLKTETHRAFFSAQLLFLTSCKQKMTALSAFGLTFYLSVSSLRAAPKLTLAWRTSRPTSGPTLERSHMCVNMKAATRPSPMLQTGPSTRTALTQTRYVHKHKRTYRVSDQLTCFVLFHSKHAVYEVLSDGVIFALYIISGQKTLTLTFDH